MSTPVYSFIRHSSGVQKTGHSDTRQESGEAAWLARRGLKLTRRISLEESAFEGKHIANPDTNEFAQFLLDVNAGKIQDGSYLLVEDISRLSRMNPNQALLMIIPLMQRLRIITLLPNEMEYSKEAGVMQYMMLMMEISRAHGESLTKQARLNELWESNRSLMKDYKILGKRCPAWIDCVKSEKVKITGRKQEVMVGEYQINKERAKVVKQIFKYAADGMGYIKITQKLIADKVKPFGSKGWTRVYIVKMLGSRTVLGEYQPKKRNGNGKYRDYGEPCIDYYPAVVTLDEFHAAQAATQDRKSVGGKIGKRDDVFLFAGVIWSAYGGRIMRKGNLALPYKAIDSGSAAWVSIPSDVLEDAILSELKEINPVDVIQSSDGNRLLTLQGEQTHKLKRIKEVETKIKTDEKYADALADVLVDLKSGEKKLAKEIAELKQSAASPITDAWNEFKNLVELKKTERLKLKSTIMRMIKKIILLVVKHKQNKYALVQIYFKESNQHRSYVISYRRKNRFNDASCEIASWVETADTDLDLVAFEKRSPAEQEQIKQALVVMMSEQWTAIPN